MTVILAAVLAAVGATAFVWTQRLPLPFDGFAALAGAALAGLGTLSLLLLAPSRWLWSEDERLAIAFMDHHGVSGQGAVNALQAISRAHGQANALRGVAADFQTDLARAAVEAADRLDASAREIFYTPRSLRALQPILARTDLIAEATATHAALRRKRQNASDDPQVVASRETLMRAIDALNAAFDDSDLRAAKGLAAQVEIASSVAESLLAPRRR